MAIKTFANDGSKDIFSGTNSKKARKVVAEHAAKAARRWLHVLHAATSIQDVTKAGGTVKPLTHTMPGVYSLRVNDQYRILFRFEKGDAYDVEIADYHAGYD